MLTHGAVASRYLGEDVVDEAFADWTQARVRPEVKVTLGMLAKLTTQPLGFCADDIKPLLAAGISPSGIEQAVIVGYIFNYQNRMADALGADVPADKVKRAGAMLNLTGRSMLKDRNSEGEIPSFDGAIPEEIQAMIDAAVDGEGDSDVALRQAVFRRSMTYLGFPATDTDIPENLVRYVDSIARHAADVTDQDIKDLLDAGWSEADVFEVTVVASIAAGNGRLRIAWSALAEALQEYQLSGRSPVTQWIHPAPSDDAAWMMFLLWYNPAHHGS